MTARSSPSRAFRSYAQNHEDVILRRMLAHIPRGHYVEAGAYHPISKSLSYAFYELGWDGVLIEPQQQLSELCELVRPRDTVVQKALASHTSEEECIYLMPGNTRSTTNTELSHLYGETTATRVAFATLNDILDPFDWTGDNFHFLVLDVEGSEGDAIAGLDLEKHHPWIAIIEAIHPITQENSSSQWEAHLLDKGYTLELFDGVSNFYLSPRYQDLEKHCYPASSTDSFFVDFPRALPLSGKSLTEDTGLLQILSSALPENLEFEILNNDSPSDTTLDDIMQVADQLEVLAVTTHALSSRLRNWEIIQRAKHGQ